MTKSLKISLETGRIEVPGLPEGATEEQKNERTLALVSEVKAELEEISGFVEEKPRVALARLWVLRTHLDAYPVRWIRNYASRKEWNDASKLLDELKEKASGSLAEGQGKQIWEDMPYIRESVQLLFAKLRAQGEVQRLILSPLGKLQFAKIKYQREGPDDLIRVCREIEEHLGKGADIDAKVRAWGDRNLQALLKGDAPAEVPAGMAPAMGPGAGMLGLGLLLLGGGGALASTGKAAPGAGAAVVGLGLAAAGGAQLMKGLSRRAALPKEFAELSAQFRERLYLICCLRGLYQQTSSYTRSSDALDTFQKKEGGAARWKRVKVDDKDLTQTFADGADQWHPKQTIENWLTEQVTKTYRLDSQSLAAQADIDLEAWEAIYRAWLLASDEYGGSGKLLDTVSDLLFVKRGENTDAERKRVFAEVKQAWAAADRQKATR